MAEKIDVWKKSLAQVSSPLENWWVLESTAEYVDSKMIFLHKLRGIWGVK